MQIELKNIEFRYNEHETTEISKTPTGGTAYRILRARVAIFRCTVDELKGDHGYEPIIEICVPYTGDLTEAGNLAKAALIQLATAINSDRMDFSVLMQKPMQF